MMTDKNSDTERNRHDVSGQGGIIPDRNGYHITCFEEDVAATVVPTYGHNELYCPFCGEQIPSNKWS